MDAFTSLHQDVLCSSCPEEGMLWEEMLAHGPNVIRFSFIPSHVSLVCVPRGGLKAEPGVRERKSQGEALRSVLTADQGQAPPCWIGPQHGCWVFCHHRKLVFSWNMSLKFQFYNLMSTGNACKGIQLQGEEEETEKQEVQAPVYLVLSRTCS
jgi:hypothetical protein